MLKNKDIRNESLLVHGGYFQEWKFPGLTIVSNLTNTRTKQGWFPVAFLATSLGYMFGPLQFYSLPFQGWAPTIPFPDWIINRRCKTPVTTWPSISKNIPQTHILRSFPSCLAEFVQRVQKTDRRGKREHSRRFPSFTSAVKRLLEGLNLVSIGKISLT